MYMIVETCGKQYRVQEGDLLKVESLGLEEGSQVILDKVLLVGRDSSTVIGSPYVEGASVSASVTENGRDPKIIVFFPKSGRKTLFENGRGGRQPHGAGGNERPRVPGVLKRLKDQPLRLRSLYLPGSLLRRNLGNTQAHEEVPAPGLEDAPARRAAAPGVAGPATAADDAERA